MRRSFDFARRAFWNRWLQLALEAAFVTISEVLLKIGAAKTAAHGTALEWLGISGLASIWVWGGIAALVLSFLCWMYVLNHLPLSVAFPLTNIVHVTIPISSWVFLGEAISSRRWLGIGIVLLGLTLVARPVARIDERL
ncbi:MAG: EamA family transporter [Chthoniobacterales bacterium]